MKKDFADWNNRKIIINEIKNVPFFHEREIWFCFLGADVGFESVAILSQIKLIDVHRLSRKIGDMNEENFSELIKKLKALLP